MKRLALLLLLPVGLLANLSSASGQESFDDLQVRTYEVGDLLLRVEDRIYQTAEGASSAFSTGAFASAGRGGFGGRNPLAVGQGGGRRAGSLGGRSANPHDITLDDLIRVITSTVSPEAWDSAGGLGTLDTLGTRLIVLQSEGVHQQITQLLDQLRGEPNRRQTVQVDARWLLLDSSTLEQLRVRGKIDPQALEKLTREGEFSIRGVTTCFSGQSVYIASGTSRTIIRGYIPVVGQLSVPVPWQVAAMGQPKLRLGNDILLAQQATPQMVNNQVGYNSILGEANYGALLQVRPTVVPGTKEAVVDLASRLTFPLNDEPQIQTPPAIGPGQVPTPDRKAEEQISLATTLRMPLGEPVLVGGFTVEPTTRRRAESEPRREQPQIYLVLQIR